MDNCTFIILGATGDLATRRLIPALYEIIRLGKLTRCLIIGAALDDTDAAHILQKVSRYIHQKDDAAWQTLEKHFFYQKIDVTQPAAFDAFAQLVFQQEQTFSMPGNRLLYLAIAPQFFCTVTEQCARVGLIKKKSDNQAPWYRVVFEKPFGSDKQSAHQLNLCIANYLTESQIFRIDHYLAKDIVGNIALLRFTNRVLEPLWNKDHIAWVEIDVSEDRGMDGRGYFYDRYGALKDVVQNHMLQIAALIAMESPVYLEGEFIRDEKARVLQCMRPVDGLLGQYQGYKQAPGVNPDSTTETFAIVQINIDNPRWKGVPFFLKTGKNLNKKETVIKIRFKDVKCLFAQHCTRYPNYLIIRIMPEPGFSLVLNVKQPGMLIQVEPISMDFCYECKFGSVAENSYKVLLQEVLQGEPSSAVRFDEIEYAWDIIDALKKMNLSIHEYNVGSAGPTALDEYAKKHGICWDIHEDT